VDQDSKTFTIPGKNVPYRDLSSVLAPTYVKDLPRLDAWGKPYEFWASGSSYTIRSSGRDGSFSGRRYTIGATTDPDADLVYSNGAFLVYPREVTSTKEIAK
jgi:hypothetical protein